MRKTLLFIIMTLVSITGIIGCKDKNKAGRKKSIVIGASMLSLQSEFVVNVRDAMVAKAGESNIEFIVTDAERSAEKQVQQIESFITQHVDAIILNPCELEASSPAIDKAKAAGIPIVNVNSETSAEPDAFVGSRDEEAGEMAIAEIARLISGKGNILIMEGYMGQAAQIKRAIGAKNALAKYPDIKVLAQQTADWDRAKGMSLMENWIQSYGNKISAVFAENDEMGMGALQALEQSGIKQKVVVVSIDAIADALQAVKDGRLDATIYQDAKGQGAGAVSAALMLAGKEPLPQKKQFIPFQLVTKSNVEKFLKAD